MTARATRARRDAVRAEYAAEEAEAAEHILTSALIRRILTRAVHGPEAPVLTVEQVEEIARRVVRESV